MDIPNFKYHPDPLATGHIQKSDTRCVCCKKARGYIYTGPVYAEEEYDNQICPWCIADGSAHEKLDVIFVDESGVGGYGKWDAVSEEVIEEVAYRTPGFIAWQQERWWTHCSDAAQFLGRAGGKELKTLGPQAIAAIEESADFKSAPKGSQLLASLHKDGAPTAYVFQCMKCRKFGGYIDFD